MRTTVGLLMLLAAVGTLVPSSAEAKSGKPGLIYYIAPNGKDDNGDGSKERPFATIARVQRSIRQLKTNHELPKGEIVVLIRGGTYPMAPGLAFDEYDSGEPRAPISWRSYPGERPVFDGGWRVPPLKPVTDRGVLARLPAEARAKVRCCNVRAAGYAHVERPPAFDREYGSLRESITDLYADGVRLDPARYPDDGQALEALDGPGKWHIDPKSGLLYVWPPKGCRELVLSEFTGTFLDIRDLHDVRFGGLTFQYGRLDAIVMRGCKNVRFSKNVIRGFGRNALTAVRSDGVNVTGNEFAYFGVRGILVTAGFAESGAPVGNVVDGNEVRCVGCRVPKESGEGEASASSGDML